MSLKAELEVWAAALDAYEKEDFERSLELFTTIADSSKILTNIGLIYATLGEHEAAIENFNAATSLDQYLAVAYFQCGVSNFLIKRYDRALKDFEEVLLNLRGNQAINYEQLGLNFKLYSAETLFNKGLCQVYMGQVDDGLKVMREASLEKCIPEHNVIDEAIRDRADGYTVFSIPVGVLYSPAENKLKNTASKDYLGKAKLIAAEDEREAYTSFTGVTRLKQGLNPSGNRLDDAPTKSFDAVVNLKRAATTVTPPAKDSTQTTQTAQTKLTRSSTTINVISREERENRVAESKGLNTSANNLRSTSKPAPEGAINDRQDRSLIPDGIGSRQPTRLTEFYDQYMDDERDGPTYSDGRQRVAAWARKNSNAGSLKRGATLTSNYTTSSLSLRRKTTGKRNFARSTMYEEDEEDMNGHNYGEPDKIRIKIHHDGNVRGMAITLDMPFEEFVDRITQKFDKPFDDLGMKYKDEDGTLITLMDESDYDLALEIAGGHTGDRSERKLEIWCKDS